MHKILVAVDGSASALRALDAILARVADLKSGAELHLVNVQYPLHGEVASFIDAAQIKQYHQEEGDRALAEAVQKVAAAGVPYVAKVRVGRPEQSLLEYVKEQGCSEMVLGAQGVGSFSSMLMGSVATKILHVSPCPVLLVR
ncbi:nucleotide-binding universal stress UspA family protein [Chitinivorax tropicus]|uniref:Nucleotide-binding universal stress UspA family protein n=1 Tax=Chitinivorax tropicus TaxID=714531 RepID=A0A840MJ55_9PROT|nr:universal stress protein [Chitinivorax tropicus]MBB5016817.1 nucleotide-binding universal stress UspA family protein [Chitinivorax tropicus]